MSPGSFFGTMWIGDAHLLENGRMMLSFSMWSDSRLAIARRSPARRRGLAKTGEPVVLVKLDTSCLTLAAKEPSLVMPGNSLRRIVVGVCCQMAAGEHVSPGVKYAKIRQSELELSHHRIDVDV